MSGGWRLRIEMHFLPIFFVTCDACAGRRYNTETLAVDYRDHNIADLLDPVLEARKLLDAFPRLCRKLDTLIDVVWVISIWGNQRRPCPGVKPSGSSSQRN